MTNAIQCSVQSLYGKNIYYCFPLSFTTHYCLSWPARYELFIALEWVISFHFFHKTKTSKKLSALNCDTVKAKHANLWYFSCCFPPWIETKHWIFSSEWSNTLQWFHIHRPAFFFFSVSLVVCLSFSCFNVIWYPAVKILKAIIWREHFILLKKVTTR